MAGQEYVECTPRDTPEFADTYTGQVPLSQQATHSLNADAQDSGDLLNGQRFG